MADIVNVEFEGIPLAVDPDNMDDIDVMDWMYEMEENNFRHMSALAKRMLGDEQYENVRETLASDNGGFKVSLLAPLLDTCFKSATKARAAEPKN